MINESQEPPQQEQQEAQELRAEVARWDTAFEEASTLSWSLYTANGLLAVLALAMSARLFWSLAGGEEEEEDEAAAEMEVEADMPQEEPQKESYI